MNISEVIVQLQRIQEEQGDLQVVGCHHVLEIEVISEEDEFEKCVYIG